MKNTYAKTKAIIKMPKNEKNVRSSITRSSEQELELMKHQPKYILYKYIYTK